MEIERAALRRARELVADPFLGKPPIDVVALGYKIGVKSIAARDMADDGYVGRRQDGGLVIRYRRANSVERNRFTIAHEIAHVIIAEESGIDVMEIKHRRGLDSEEIIANAIAAEILMPAGLVRKFLTYRPPSWSSLFAMRGAFHVSTTAMVRRLTEIQGVAAVFIQVDYPVREGSLQMSCRASKHVNVLFPRRLTSVARDLVSEFDQGIRLSLDVVVDNEPVSIDCAGRLMRQFDKPAYWFVGWKCL